MPLGKVGKVAIGLAALILLGACSLSGGKATPSPASSTSTNAPTTAPPPSPGTTASAAPTATPGGTPSSAASCTGAIPSTANLVLASLTGSPTVVLRDISNVSSPRTICTFVGSVSPHFVTASVVGLVQASIDGSGPGRITRLDLATGIGTDVRYARRVGVDCGLGPAGRIYVADAARWRERRGRLPRLDFTDPGTPSPFVSGLRSRFDLQPARHLSHGFATNLRI